MRVFPVLLLLVMTAGPLAAQQLNPLSLTVGDQIRMYEPGNTIDSTEGYMMALNAPSRGWVSGSVTMLGDDGFSFVVDGDSHVYTQPYETMDVIDVKRRIRSQSIKSAALWGVYLGAALGAISAPFAAKSTPLDTGPSVALFGVAGGVGGAALGAAMGAVIVPSRWYRYVFP